VLVQIFIQDDEAGARCALGASMASMHVLSNGEHTIPSDQGYIRTLTYVRYSSNPILHLLHLGCASAVCQCSSSSSQVGNVDRHGRHSGVCLLLQC
jgi:hypothetical protein